MKKSVSFLEPPENRVVFNEETSTTSTISIETRPPDISPPEISPPDMSPSTSTPSTPPTPPDFRQSPTGHYRFLDLLHGHFDLDETFESLRCRNKYVQRIYLILASHFLIVSGFIAIPYYIPLVKSYIQRNKVSLFIFFMGIYLVLVLALICNTSLRRKGPINLVLMVILILSVALILSVLTVTFQISIILYAACAITMVLFSGALLAVQEKWDVTSNKMYFYVVLTVTFVVGLLMLTIYMGGSDKYELVQMAYASVIIYLFSIWVTFDIKRLITNKTLQLSSNECTFGALTVHTDLLDHILFPVTYTFRIGFRVVKKCYKK